MSERIEKREIQKNNTIKRNKRSKKWLIFMIFFIQVQSVTSQIFNK
jgi:hypothetical protein